MKGKRIGKQTLLLGNAKTILPQLKPNSFDLVLSDPPYDRPSLWLYQLLLNQSARLLKPGGFLLSIIPHYAFPELMAWTPENLRWRWLSVIDQDDGNYPRLVNACKTIWVTYKPIGWWYKIPRKQRDFSPIRDSFKNPQPDKKHHKWEQSETWANYCLDFLPNKGEGNFKVLDPFIPQRIGLSPPEKLLGCKDFQIGFCFITLNGIALDKLVIVSVQFLLR